MGLFGIKSKAEIAAELQAEKEARDKASREAQKAKEDQKAKERYNSVMPIVKSYFEKIGFELPPDENIFFMEVDENTGKWKYATEVECSYKTVRDNPQYTGPKGILYQTYKYIVNEKAEVVKISRSDGILLAPDGKAYIGTCDNGKFWWHTEKGMGINKSFLPKIQNVLAVGNITDQLLCGVHIKYLKLKENANIWYSSYNANYTNDAEEQDEYWRCGFPESVKRIFILPSDESQKKNTVVIGAPFDLCSNLSLFYSGFDKVTHEKFYSKNDTFKAFSNETHASFIAPSEESLDFFNTEEACKNWEFKIGTTIQNAVSLKEIRSAEKASTLAETKAVLEELESEVAAKKAEKDSLGRDAQSIVKKAKLNKEIKELEPQIETLKAEVERLSK